MKLNCTHEKKVKKKRTKSKERPCCWWHRGWHVLGFFYVSQRYWFDGVFFFCFFYCLLLAFLSDQSQKERVRGSRNVCFFFSQIDSPVNFLMRPNLFFFSPTNSLCDADYEWPRRLVRSAIPNGVVTAPPVEQKEVCNKAQP